MRVFDARLEIARIIFMSKIYSWEIRLVFHSNVIPTTANFTLAEFAPESLRDQQVLFAIFSDQ